MEKIFLYIFFALKIIIGLLYFFAICDLITDWTGNIFWGWFLGSLSIWFLHFFGPILGLIGTIAGIYQSVNSWGWNIWPSVLFFLSPLFLTLIAFLVADTIEKNKHQQ